MTYKDKEQLAELVPRDGAPGQQPAAQHGQEHQHGLAARGGGDVFFYFKLGVTRSILNGHIFKNSVLTPIFIFLFTPEVDFQYPKCQVITTIKPEHLPFEFQKSVY